jgi:hypothetical protein
MSKYLNYHPVATIDNPTIVVHIVIAISNVFVAPSK